MLQLQREWQQLRCERQLLRAWASAHYNVIFTCFASSATPKQSYSCSSGLSKMDAEMLQCGGTLGACAAPRRQAGM